MSILIYLLLVGFILSTLIQLFYWIFVFSKLARYQDVHQKNEEKKPVSVIICAKNEAQNLKKNLPFILAQNYDFYEVIVVDDNSSDETFEVLLEFQKNFSILHPIRRNAKPTGKIGKKAALAIGIAAARYETLLLTDADCQPNSPEWIDTMQRHINNGIAVGLGYSPYFKYKSVLNTFIRYETVQTAIQYLSFALWGHPYMGVGRNLIYKKSLYLSVKGFKSHEHIASGDDDLFINAISHLDNSTIIVEKNAFVFSAPKMTLKSFIRQKSRHLTTSTSYKLKHQVLLGLLSSSHIAHYFLGTFTLFWGSYPLAIGGYIARMGIILLVSRSIYRKLDEKRLFLLIPILDAMMVIYYVFLAPVLIWGARNRW